MFRTPKAVGRKYLFGMCGKTHVARDGFENIRGPYAFFGYEHSYILAARIVQKCLVGRVWRAYRVVGVGGGGLCISGYGARLSQTGAMKR